MALEKPTRENQSERERDIISFTVKINLSQPTQITQQTVLVSVLMLPRFLCKSLLKKCAEITATNSPRFLCLRALNAALKICAKNSQRQYCTDCIKCSRTALKKRVVFSREMCQISSSKSVPDFSWKSCPKTELYRIRTSSSKLMSAINAAVPFLEMCANNKC